MCLCPHLLTQLLLSVRLSQAKKKDLSATQVGLIMGVYTMAQAVLSPVLGPWLPVIGIKRSIIVGSLVSGVTSLGLGLMHWAPAEWTFFWLSFCLRALDAVGTILISVAAFALINVQFVDRSEAVFVSVCSCYSLVSNS